MRPLPRPPIALLGALVAAGTLGAAAVVIGADAGKPTTRLDARAVLPATTFADGPTSGTLIGTAPINGITGPFTGKQPVQGFSGIIDNKDGTFWVMSDNGYGAMENSADFNLRLHKIRPDFKTAKGGSGTIKLEGNIELRDPDKKIPWAIANHFTSARVLTGADFDIESVQRTKDGTLWFGDEFGPFLIHTDATGKVLERPISMPDLDRGGEIRSPQNPLSEESSAVRIMNAVRTHARLAGNTRTPVFSPWNVMIDDGNTTAAAEVENRVTPPAGSGLRKAASGIFNVTSIKNAGYPVVTWTVNDKARMLELMKLKVDGIISDRPDLLLEAAKEFDANGDGKGGDFLTADGLIDITKLDAQGHRGARNLRPENTIPAMESALDNLMTTLEVDTGVTKDGVAVLFHDPYAEAAKCRRADGKPYEAKDDVLLKNHTVAELQSLFVCDKLFRGPAQVNTLSLSPVSVAYATAAKLPTPYAIPTLQQVFDFVAAYQAYYATGAGKSHPDAAKRAKNAGQVRYNIETKLNPRTDTDSLGNVFATRTVEVSPFTKAVAGTIVKNGLEARADIQSFDFRSLLQVQTEYPKIRTVYLFGDFPKYADPKIAGSDDGTNLQPQGGPNTPWLAGLYWPYRETALANPFRAPRSGGLEGMALSADGKTLLPLLEKPLADDSADTLLIHEFDIASRTFSDNQYRYRLDPGATAIGDFVMTDKRYGLIIERDESQGLLDTVKRIYEVDLKHKNVQVRKRLVTDLLDIQDPDGISKGGLPGDVGLGAKFAFPFQTIEDVVILGKDRIGVLNDNNFPFSVGRHVGAKAPDDNEFVILKLDRNLSTAKPSRGANRR